jgi:signal-transduction protein with cAMP-binding, CBS, and nucleotidyltransferase domain
LSEIEINVNEPISKFIQNPIVVSATESVKKAAEQMLARGSGEVLVTQNNEVSGIVTEWDILSRVVAKGKSPGETKVADVMSSPVLSVDPSIKTGEAIRLMSKKKYRRLVVKEGNKLLGVVTLSQVVGSSRNNTITLPLLEPASGSRCPYCGSILKDRDELSSHIDRVHIREEMLRGAHGPNP